MEIPLPQLKEGEEDIYSFGFDKHLYRADLREGEVQDFNQLFQDYISRTILDKEIVGGSVSATLTTAAGSSIDGQYIESATISGDKLVNATITATQIANATITATQIANATITTTQISGTAGITGTQIASGTITATNITDATITGGKIAAGTITATNITDGTITGGKIDAATITGTNLADGTVTGGKIDSLTITAGNIANLTITAAQIGNTTIDSTKLTTALYTEIDANLPSDENLVGYWSFDEGSGTKAYDGSNQGNDGTLTNMTDADWVAGVVGTALDFDGTDDYVDIPYDASLYSATWSFSLWIYRSVDSGGYERLLCYSSAAVIYDKWLQITDADTVQFGFVDTGGVGRYVPTTDTIPLNTWKHLVGTFDGTYLKIYINGELKVTSPDYSAYTPRNNNLNVWIGRLMSGYGFNGKIDEVRIYNTALTAKEAYALYKNPAGNKGLVYSGTRIAPLTIAADKIVASTITGAKIAADTITAANIAANTITASELTTGAFVTATANISDAIITDAKISDLAVSKLTAGSITSKAITLAVAAGTGDSYIAAGKTDFTNTDAGFILGIDDSDADLAKFYIGDATNYLTWNGSELKIYSNLADGITLDYGSNMLLKEGGSIKFTSVTAPGACTATLIATAVGNLSNGAYKYKVTFVTAAGETELGTISNTVTVDADNKQVALSAIPTSSSGAVTSRKIYRTTAGGTSYYLLTTINDNSTTTYTDNIADGDLGADDATFKNSSAIGIIKVGTRSQARFYDNNTFLGRDSGRVNTTGYYNVGVGRDTFYYNTTGKTNSAFGTESLKHNTTGSYNCAFNSLVLNTTGVKNSGFGYTSLRWNETGNYNTAFGCDALYFSTGSSNIALGHCAGYYETGSNAFYVNNQYRTDTAGDKSKSIIYGVMAADPANQDLTINANIFNSQIKSGATQAGAGAAANEIWKTASHATLPDNVLMIGV